MHMYVLIYLINLCEPFIDREGDESLIPDGEFAPNIKNSVMFVYQWWLQCGVIFVNYSGRPFMQDFSENGKLKWLMAANFLVLACCIFDTSDELRETFQLVAYPTDVFKEQVIRILMVDLAFCYFIETTCKRIYLRTFITED